LKLGPTRSKRLPVKRVTSGGLAASERLHWQASRDVIKNAAVESQSDVVTKVHVLPRHRLSNQRSRGLDPRSSRLHTLDQLDMLITNREDKEMSSALDMLHLSSSSTFVFSNSKPSSPGHTAHLAQATGVPLIRRVLSYHEPPPSSSSSTDPTPALARECAQWLIPDRPSCPRSRYHPHLARWCMLRHPVGSSTRDCC